MRRSSRGSPSGQCWGGWWDKTATQQVSPAHAWGQAPGARAGPLIPNQASAEAWPCKRLSTAARATENLRHTRVKIYDKSITYKE